MKTAIINVDNIKCGGCANSVRKGLEKIEGVQDVKVDIESGEVNVDYEGNIDRSQFVEALGKMGYPEVGTGNTMQKVKSYVSCAVGRMS